MLRRYRKGQTALEYIVLLIIVMGALLGISNYFKRGMQGRWKAATDDMGDQYDPRTADSSIRHTLTQNTNTTIITMNDAGGYWTRRTDNSFSTDQKTGTVSVGAY
ncbi:MAG: hypothetical protein HZC18_02655 [Candidatus Omnitrophica bacterium]|nr:hypothetical protein [Candidatus Omnitrophota bacterium]